MSKWRLAVLCTAALVMSACAGEVTGGGYIQSANTASTKYKASYAFDLTCQPIDWFPYFELEGSWVYHDKYTKMDGKTVDVGGTLAPGYGIPCEPGAETPGYGEWILPYGRLGKTGTGSCTSADVEDTCVGVATISVSDGGDIGNTKNDQLGISLETINPGGLFDGYTNGPKYVQGGNLKVYCDGGSCPTYGP